MKDGGYRYAGRAYVTTVRSVNEPTRCPLHAIYGEWNRAQLIQSNRWEAVSLLYRAVDARDRHSKHQPSAELATVATMQTMIEIKGAEVIWAGTGGYWQTASADTVDLVVGPLGAR